MLQNGHGPELTQIIKSITKSFKHHLKSFKTQPLFSLVRNPRILFSSSWIILLAISFMNYNLASYILHFPVDSNFHVSGQQKK